MNDKKKKSTKQVRKDKERELPLKKGKEDIEIKK